MSEPVWWHTKDNASPNLSKASLGEFCYTVLKVGATLGRVWPFNPKYDRCWVGCTIQATEEQKNEIEARTKFRFKPPPEVHLN